MHALRVGDAELRFTGRAEGDLGHGGAYVHDVAPAVARRRRAVADLPWTWLRQVHGDRVVRVARPGDGAGERADAAVTLSTGAAIAVLAADCAPVALVGEGAVAVAHAGWRGAVAGVLDAAVTAVSAAGDGRPPVAVVGPCIHAECYAFGADDLNAVAAALGDGVRAQTASGADALDLVAAVTNALSRAGVSDVTVVGGCTACTGTEHGDAAYFSHRARHERQRQALVAWRAP